MIAEDALIKFGFSREENDFRLKEMIRNKNILKEVHIDIYPDNPLTSSEFLLLLRTSENNAKITVDNDRLIFKRNDKYGLMIGCFFEEKLIGYVQVLRNLHSNDDLVIANLVVIEEYRGKGIAKNLLYKACNYFESNEFTPVILQVRKDNA